MPIKIAVWNVENFGAQDQKALENQAVAAGEDSEEEESEAPRINAIKKLVNQTDADVFVLIEVMAEPAVISSDIASKKTGYRDSLIGGQVATSLILLKETLGKDWCLVPPRLLSVTSTFKKRGADTTRKTYIAGGGDGGVTNECIAVFYNSKKVQFTGPNNNVLNNTKPGKPGEPGSGTDYYVTSLPNNPRKNPYPTLWKDCLPDEASTYSGTILDLNNNSRQNQYPLHCNMPFLTSFVDIETGVPFQLISFHASWSQQDKFKSLATRALLEKVKGIALEGFQQIIVGDFNDKLDQFANDKTQIAIPSTMNTTLVNKRDGVKSKALVDYEYPYYGYLKNEATDNAIVFKPTTMSSIICNPFVGFPYGQKQAPEKFLFSPELKVKDHVGAAAFESLKVKNAQGYDELLKFYKEYKDISDHLPIVIEVTLNTSDK